MNRAASVSRIAAALVVVWHITAELITGAVPPIRDVVWPLIEFYSDGLRMTNRWGMFTNPPSRSEVVVIAHYEDGTEAELATNYTSSRSGFARIRDVRLRKLQGKFLNEHDRKHFGQAYLAYFCDQVDGGPVERVSLLERNPDAPSKPLLSRRCASQYAP